MRIVIFGFFFFSYLVCSADVGAEPENSSCRAVTNECVAELKIPTDKPRHLDDETSKQLVRCIFKNRQHVPECGKYWDDKIAKLSWLQRRMFFNLVL